MKYFARKNTFKIFGVLLVLFSLLFGVRHLANNAVKEIETPYKVKINKSYKDKIESGIGIEKAMQEVFVENAEFMLEYEKTKKKRIYNIGIYTLISSVLLLYIAAVVLSIIIRKT